jgi:hypothetical protein
MSSLFQKSTSHSSVALAYGVRIQRQNEDTQNKQLNTEDTGRVTHRENNTSSFEKCIFRSGMYMCLRGIDFGTFYNFSIAIWNCSNIMVFSVFHFIASLAQLLLIFKYLFDIRFTQNGNKSCKISFVE